MKLGSVHDNLFRYAMRHTEVAQAFIHHYLPTELSEQFDLSTLKIHKDTFIDPELQEFFADTLYEASLVDGSRGGFYFLFEHKSFAKRQTVFDLLGYMVRIWQQQAQQKSKYEQLKLKPIVPIVLYHGPKGWTKVRSFGQLFDEQLPEEFKRFVPDYDYILCDLSEYSDEEIKGEVLLRIVWLIFKYIYSGEFLERLPGILSLLRELEDLETGLLHLRAILRYLSEQEVVKITPQELKDAVEEALPEKGGELMASLAEVWKAEAFKEGIEKGMEKGELKTRRRTILDALVLRFNPPVLFYRQVEEYLSGISDRVTLEKLFATVIQGQELSDFQSALGS